MTGHAPGTGPELHIVGPPGTGKTTALSGRIRTVVADRGSDAIAIASFTTAAAAELAGRNLPVGPRQIGTLHAHAYRAIDTPPVAAERIGDWNDTHPAYAIQVPRSRRAAADAGELEVDEAPTEGTGGATEADVLFAEMEALRNRLVPVERWPAQVRALHEKWTAWKRDEGVVDFTDMIEIALADTSNMPGDPEVGFFDECQDNTNLEMRLIRKWAARMKAKGGQLVLAYDDDQQLYRFRGASVDELLAHPVPDDDRRVLAQSYRVPAAVHRAAERWIQRTSKREPKAYLPRAEEGRVRLAPVRYSEPEPLLAQVELASRDGSVMVLAACSYMLDPVKHLMRESGVPFHNPYRRRRGDWNPLTPGRGVSARERLAAYLILDERMFGEAARLWTGGDIQRWSHVVKTAGVFRRGGKEAIKGLPDRELTYAEVAGLFADEQVLERAVQPDLTWFRENLLAANKPTMEFPIRVAERYGGAALIEEPRICLGTIHSVKGGQADTVFLIPDLSIKGHGEWSVAGDPRDSVIRQYYVAMTRARRELVVCDTATDRYVPPVRLVQGAREAA